MTVASLHEPAQDRPAMADLTTAILFDLMRQRAWRLVAACVLIAVAIGPLAALTAHGLEENPPYPLASGLVLIWIFAAFNSLWILWVPRSAPLLRTWAWRPARARVVRAGRPSFTSLIECDGDLVLRVDRLSPAHHALIARTGRVWVVGCDDKGWAAVRVDGSHVVFPARRAKVSREVPVQAEGDVTALTAARMRFGATAQICLLSGVLAWTAVMLALDVRLTYLGSILGLSVAMAAKRRFSLVDRKLPALVADAEWCELPVSMNPWFWREDGTSTAEGVVALPDGRTLALRMPNATVDLLGTIYERGTGWFSAPPASGKTVAVGFPGYPLLAVATIR
ncbi:hypothetical protein SAMN05192558_103188 [Actinokineospora alba]|uniref:Uncharacterized protein n=1 Tax=Actinokineospora alba TaxID=504798 RepID=A0A1H0JSA6_9PSEU|nr:hypothetical protein [Actinokineospora alba]TDP68190.1 hypothetical protein C8E96_3754 [Actinokineospora alba]SDH93913.1 hypothetical protein SAMN05421871_102861 [Actinokineospora alba]SDO46392.1 hypothetical protein SAMN05192558_103188 [Actinokineospora alba]